MLVLRNLQRVCRSRPAALTLFGLAAVTSAVWYGCAGSEELSALGSAATTGSSSGGFDDTGSGGGATGGTGTTTGDPGTNISFGGSQDFGYFRKLLEAGQVPALGDFDSAGFFAEHHTPLPPPTCGNLLCLQPMLAQLGNLSNMTQTCTLVQIGLNTPLEADPGNRPPLTLSVVVDVSGSMAQQGKIDFVRDGLGMLIDGLLDTDRMALVTYSNSAAVAFPMSDVATNRFALRQVADGLQAGGATNLYAGLELGYTEALTSFESGRQNRIIFLSDGEATEGITDSPAILEMSKAYNSEGVGITTVGLGESFNAELMRSLALQGDGNFYFLEDAGAVEEVFTEELSYFTVPVAFDLEITLSAGDRYFFGQAYGTPLWVNDSPTGGRLELPSVFLAHRESADDVTDAGGRRGGGSALIVELFPHNDDGTGITSAEVATVNLSFREPGTDAIVTEELVVNYPMAPWVTPAKGFFDSPDVPIIQKSFVMLNIYIGIERACRDFHDGKHEEIIGMLRRLVAAVEDYNDGIDGGQGDTDIAFDLELLNDLISVLLQNGVPDPDNPQVPEDPWPADD